MNRSAPKAEADPEEIRRALLQQARELESQFDYEAAIPLLQRALDMKWEPAVAVRLVRGLSFYERDRECVREVERLAQEFPSVPEYRLYQATSKIALGRFREAREILENLGPHEDIDTQLSYTRACLAIAENRLEDAIREYELALEMRPEGQWPTLHLSLALLYGRMGRGGDQEAQLKKGLSSRPKNILLLIGYFDYLLDQGELNAAADALEAARGVSPTHTLVAVASFRLDLALGKPEKASTELLEFAATYSDPLIGFKTAGRKFYNARMYEDAVTAFGEVLRRRPSDLPTHRLLVKSLFRLRRYRDGFSALGTYLTVE